MTGKGFEIDYIIFVTFTWLFAVMLNNVENLWNASSNFGPTRREKKL